MEKFHRGYEYIGGVCDGLGNYFNDVIYIHMDVH